ncbi:Beta/Gamma crystallin [Nitrosospira sp. Nsp13]|nr:Beta/Gamma crystallin [Nitrosospira sp. Nsp13]
MGMLIKNFFNFLTATTMAFGISIVGSVGAQENIPSSKPVKNGGTMVEVPVTVMVPIQVSKNLAMAKGCWVKLYGKKNFEGGSLLLIGPINVEKMIDPLGGNWKNKVRSLETGSNANFIIYDNQNFRDENKFIDPNKRIPDLSKKMGFFDDIRSMQLNCI